ncbi:MAG TPA: DUF4405 domain-containing protein [Paracoccus sp. (in: a-proteobacteria)]|nr:DUF4405 domain-containing protein [Paracoccus sp. (in: a-proteobacteria)]
MPILLNRYATPFLSGIFLVSLISGLALLFHVAPGAFHGMHEWLSLLLIVPFALHLWKNWRPMKSYLKHAPMAVATAVSVALAALFLIPGDQAGAGGNPAVALMGKVAESSAAELAPLLDATPDAVLAALNGAGIAVADAGQPLAPAAAAAGKTAMDIAAALRPLLD